MRADTETCCLTAANSIGQRDCERDIGRGLDLEHHGTIVARHCERATQERRFAHLAQARQHRLSGPVLLRGRRGKVASMTFELPARGRSARRLAAGLRAVGVLAALHAASIPDADFHEEL